VRAFVEDSLFLLLLVVSRVIVLLRCIHVDTLLPVRVVLPELKFLPVLLFASRHVCLDKSLTPGQVLSSPNWSLGVPHWRSSLYFGDMYTRKLKRPGRNRQAFNISVALELRTKNDIMKGIWTKAQISPRLVRGNTPSAYQGYKKAGGTDFAVTRSVV
jgi:hypothetical protein